MQYEMIRNIWHDYVASKEYQKGFDYQISNEDAARLEKELGYEKYSDIEEVAMRLASDAEEAGFIQGFKIATKLMKECFQ